MGQDTKANSLNVKSLEGVLTLKKNSRGQTLTDSENIRNERVDFSSGFNANTNDEVKILFINLHKTFQTLTDLQCNP